ncbi:MAG: hypothetical protein ACJAT0_000704 [Nonlabens sp.]|jgi:hypothetical protein
MLWIKKNLQFHKSTVKICPITVLKVTILAHPESKDIKDTLFVYGTVK